MDTKNTQSLIKQFKHRIHQFEGTIAKLEKTAGKETLPRESSAEVRKHLASLKGELQEIIAEAESLPDVADALGLSPRPDPEPIETGKVVKATQFKSSDLEIEPAEGTFLTPLAEGWPRSGQVIRNNKLITKTMVGKVRLTVHNEAKPSQGVAAVPFSVSATPADGGKPMVLKRGTTNRQGYAAVDLRSLAVESVSELAIEIDGAGEPIRHVIDKDSIATHRDLGIAHDIRIRPEILDRLRLPESGEVETEGTIEDPDDIDYEISPDSFGLNHEENDGNCCLRPRTEFASRQYYFRQLIRVQEPHLMASSRVIEREDVRAPVPFGDDTASTYAITGGNLILGTVSLYRQGWYPIGRGLGELLYSLSLAPCEHVNLAFIDWSRQERDTRQESRTASEQLDHDMDRDRSIEELVDSVLEENQSGSSSSGGGGASLDLGIFSIGGGGGSTSSSASGRRNLQASTIQNISDSISQRSSALRSQRATVVTTSTQRESERIQTRTVHNHNRNHAMTVQYFQVLSHYAIKTELVEEKPVVMVPYQVDPALFDTIPSFDKFVAAPSRPITRFLDRHSRLIRRLAPGNYRRAFESLSRLLHCRDVYDIETPYATLSRWEIRLSKAYRPGLRLYIETDSGQTVQLYPSGNSREPVYFQSSPVRHDDIRGLTITFDPVAAAEGMSRDLPGLFGDAFGDLLEQLQAHQLDDVQVSVVTDRSRFLPHPQRFRLGVDAVDARLDTSNPSIFIAIEEPEPDFSRYRGREHQDYCALKELIAHIQSQPMRYIRAIWMSEDPDRRAMRFDRFRFEGDSLLDRIGNRPVGVLGNYVAFELLQGHKLVPVEMPDHLVSRRVVSVPTRGVFAEVFLSCCNATEKRDVERFIDPDQSCQITAPEITGVSPGSRASRSDTRPTDFPAPMVNIQNPPAAPDPSAMSSALSVLSTPDIFRDLTRGAELLQFIESATKEAFTSTRQHRAAMDAIAGDVVRGLVSAYTGVPIPSGSGSSGKSGQSSGPGNVTPTSSGSGGSGKTLTAPITTSSNNPALQSLTSDRVRQSSPAQLSDHLQTIQRAVERGQFTPEQGQSLGRYLYGQVDDQSGIMLASYSPGGIESEPLGTTTRTVDVKLRCFIPSQAVSLQVPLTDDYGGDNRSFSYDQGSHRVQVHQRLTFGTSHPWPRVEAAPGAPGGGFSFGETKAYSQGDTENVAGKPWWWKRLKDGAAPSDTATLGRTDDNLHAVASYDYAQTAESHWSQGPLAAKVYLRVDAPNPLVDSAPAINADLWLQLKEYNGKLYYRLTGTHDGFPAYELYVDECLVYSHDPEAEGQSPLSLFPPSEYTVNKEWQVLDCEEDDPTVEV